MRINQMCDKSDVYYKTVELNITEGSVTRQNHQRYLKFTQISVKFQISVQISEFQYLISINKYCQFLALISLL